MRLAGIKRHALLAPFTDHQDAINVLPNVDFLLTIADWRAVQCGHRSQDYRLRVGLYDNAGADLLGQIPTNAANSVLPSPAQSATTSHSIGPPVVSTIVAPPLVVWMPVTFRFIWTLPPLRRTRSMHISATLGGRT